MATNAKKLVDVGGSEPVPKDDQLASIKLQTLQPTKLESEAASQVSRNFSLEINTLMPKIEILSVPRFCSLAFRSCQEP